MGPMFKQWIDKGVIGVPIIKDKNEFLECLLNTSDAEMEMFAKEYLGFTREKGIDFIAKFNQKYIIGEAKFLTDFGGHQNAQFEDAISTLKSDIVNKKVANEVIPIAILDGVLYVEGNSKMYRYLNNNKDHIIISSLLLREFLYSI